MKRPSSLRGQAGSSARPPLSSTTPTDPHQYRSASQEIDTALGGGLRAGLHLLVGFQHNGKTQLLLRLLWENRDKPMCLFSPDEAAEQVMFKLISLATATPLADVIPKTASWKRGIIQEHFPLLAIDDEKRSKYDTITYMSEAEQYFQQEIKLCAYDYMGYLASSRGEDFGGSMQKAANIAKDLARDTRIPWLMLHQANRSASKGGQLSASSLSYGGEQQAVSILTVRRPQPSDPNMTTRDQLQEEHQPLLTVGLIKNKATYSLPGRVPRQRGKVCHREKQWHGAPNKTRRPADDRHKRRGKQRERIPR